jgi:HEAT repeat protein
MALSEILSELIDTEKDLSAVELGQFNSLLDEDLEDLNRRWELIPEARRYQVLVKLTEMADDDVELDFYAVFRLAMQDSLPKMREAGVGGLWETEDRVALPLLLECLDKDNDASVRAAAARVLARFAVLADSGKLVQRDRDAVYAGLMRALGDDDELVLVRRRALESVAPMRFPDVQRWLQWGYDHPDPSMRQSALFGMGRSGDTTWLSTICEEMDSEDPGMRFEAANAAREMGEEEAVSYLIDLVNDLDTEVSAAALQAIGGIGGAAAKKILRALAADDDEEVISEAAAQILTDMANDESDFSMLRLDRDESM